MSIDSVVSIAWDALKRVLAPIKRQFGYVMSSKSYALDLQKEVGRLAFEAERVRNAVEEARSNLPIVYIYVVEWQASAENVLEEAGDLLDDFEKATKTCCYGTLPDPHCRYQFSRKAKHKIEVIMRLARICSEFKDLNDISFSDPAPGNVAARTLARREGKDVVQSTTVVASASSASRLSKLRDDGVFESRATIIKGIMDALADNSNSVVGVYGMGGVGKSTLLVDAERRIREDKCFDWVAKADVSENPDIRRIQGEIAHALGLTDMMDKETDRGRAELLHRRLEDEEREKRKVLIILDNLWERLDLKSVGIPCRHDNKVMGCKLLLTSRNQDVLRREMCCDRDFRLGGLQEAEAKRLFERMVGDKVHDGKFKPLVDEALRKCEGLPFLILTMAKLLKDASFSEWKKALKRIEMSKSEVTGMAINKMLQLSYDNLEEEVKSVLQLCVVCGVSEPSFENLVRYGVGLGLLREDSSMEEARDRLSSVIHALQASSLLLDNEDAEGFKVHGLVREFVASVHPILVLKDEPATQLSKEKLKSCWGICFPYIDMNELPNELDCPKLSIFLLFANNKSLEIPDSFFNSMRKLMVLNLHGIRLTRSPSPFRFLENLHTLCVDDCSLEDVSILGELKGLQILSFVNSKIHRLPKEIGQLAELRLLDLNHCSLLQIIEPGVLGSLIKLEELYMENSFDQWNAVEQTPPTNASLIELNNMKNLCTLHVSIPNPSVLPEDLNVAKLIKYSIQIGEVWRQSSYKGSRTLKLKLNPISDILQKGCVQTTLGITDDLFLDNFDGVEQSICQLSLMGFPKLKHLQVQNSPSVHYILQGPSDTAFKMLESLLLKNLINLEKIWHNHIFSKSFKTLKVVRVESCDKMEHLFPLSLVREFPQLEEIGVIDCYLMREIVEADGYGKVELCNLHVLELRDLPDIKRFFTAGMVSWSDPLDGKVGTQVAFFNGQQISMPSLESLTMAGVPNLKDIWSDESPFEMSNLRSLKVAGCILLSKVINFGSLIRLHKLHTLTITHCISVHEIFYLDGPSPSGNVETLSELTTFCLEELPSLRRIWSLNPCGIVGFHNLKQLKVFGCKNLEFMFFPSMIKSLVQLRELMIRNCKKMEAVIMEEEQLGMEILETLAFPMLTCLHFERLESLTCFSRGKCSREARSQDCVKLCSTALFNGEIAFPCLETLYIDVLDNIEMIWDDQVTEDSFPNLKSLDMHKCNKLKCVWDKEIHRQVKFQCLHSVHVSRCKSLTSLFPASVARDLMQLEELKIHECGIVELIEKEEGLAPMFVFPNLTSLELKHLTELVCLYAGTHTSHWPALKTLEVHGCNKVDILASQTKNEMPCHKQPLFLIEKGAFPNLQELNLDLSERMEIWHGHFHNEEFFCKLRFLKIHHLSQESSISTCRFIESLTNLEELVVCESYLEDPSNNEDAIERTSHELNVILPFLGYIQHLQNLDVSLCDGLSTMFTPTIAKNLVALTKLRISNCRILTEVLRNEEGEEGCVVAFNQLKYMELDGLIELRCFSSGGYTLMFPLLEDVTVNGCPNMKFFSEGPIEAPKLERVQVSLKGLHGPTKYQHFWKGNLNITIQNMFEEMATVVGAKFVRLFEFPELIGKWHSDLNPIKSSWQLETLVVDKCPSFVNAVPFKLMLVLEKMTSLQVRECESMKEIFDLERLEAGESTRVLPRLQNLDLVNLPKLRQLWNKDLQGTMCFDSLSDLTFYNCSNLRLAFTPSMARCLANLEWMKIKECGQMEGVIVEEEEKGSAVEKISFPKLWAIELECLPNLTSFLSGKDHTLECPQLDRLTIAYCPKIRSLTWQSSMDIDHGIPSLFTPQVQFPQLARMVLSHMDNLSKIWTDGPQETLAFDYLREMEAQNCKSLENLFPHWMATSLNQLEELRVESCGIEEIVTNGDDTPHFKATEVLFPKLTSLVLHDMPRLKSFCPNLPTLNWPFLEELRVTHCDKMNLSFVASMSKWSERDDQRDLSDQETHPLFERAFPNLKRLLLVDKDIQMILDGKFPDDIFGKPESLTLACFHDEKAVFPPRFLLERFHNLQSLEVFCSSFEDIFPDEGPVEEGKHMVLESLRELKLSKLHNLKRVWREDYLLAKVLQSIKTFEVWDCPALTTLFPAVSSFQNLTELVVKNSSRLVHLVTVSAVTNLEHLIDMTIIGCEIMKEVVASNDNGEGKVISLGKLKRLTLKHLPSLVCFSSTASCSFRFPSLWSIEVEECPKMKIFSKGALGTPRLHYATLFKYDLEWKQDDDLNTTIQKLSS